MRPRDLAPNATVVAAVLLHLGLVYVRQALTSVPGHLFLGVHILDLNQRRTRILIRLGPVKNQNPMSKIQTPLASSPDKKFMNFVSVPLVSKNSSSHIESAKQ